ncbi:RcpC/CpaB family pilus assembly protein [Arthrobacter sp. ISL-30]|uniref:Flp pilus assembly protein CpaB n=1 Tax=Arthrobacter sp. ISL-30 TaxID=2819109 RepID=UPI001BE557AA|nr:RcpC/CpaB family pilus assembly protein [Arthrobacter sp. ISL-30]MBT2514315.1 flagellar biosynthesis protein FlgA [Arthrobacter sp. ISL-30]
MPVTSSARRSLPDSKSGTAQSPRPGKRYQGGKLFQPRLAPPRPGFGARFTWRQRWRARLSRNRRLIVALLLCLAAGIAVNQLTPATERRVEVMSAAHDLPAGSTLGSDDIAVLHVAPGVAPSGAFTTVESLQGKQLASPLRKGQIPTDAQLLGPGLLAGSQPGTAAVPLRMADPSSVQLVATGQLVNVVMTSDGEYGRVGASEVLATAVPVLWTSSQGGKPGQWLGTNETDGLLVVAANPDQAAKLAGASTQGKLFFTLVNAPPP